MSRTTEIRVLVVDDHPVVRDGIRAILGTASDITVVAEAGDGRAAIAAFREHEPDVVLMDLRMPVMDGADAIAAILRVAPGARAIVLTTFEGDEEIHRALGLGAKAYLLKDTRGPELIEAIRAVHAGRRHVAPDVAARLAQRPTGRDLTEREIQVLELVARGLSNREIGGELGVAEGTVKAHLNAVLRKLEARDRTDAVMIALRRGIIRAE